MAFAIEDYLDDDFDHYQVLIGKLSPTTPLVDFRDIQVLIFPFLYSFISG